MTENAKTFLGSPYYLIYELARKQEACTDTVDCVLVKTLGNEINITRTYVLASDGDDIWGCDPDGNEMEMSCNDFVNQYEDSTWIMEIEK